MVALALALPIGDVFVRLCFGALLNLLVYLNNDYLDVVEDSASPTKDAGKTRYLAAHRPAALRVQLVMLAVLLVVAWGWGGGLVWPLLLGGGICWAYSAVLKHWPFVDVLAMMVWGGCHASGGRAPRIPGRMDAAPSARALLWGVRDHPGDAGP